MYFQKILVKIKSTLTLYEGKPLLVEISKNFI